MIIGTLSFDGWTHIWYSKEENRMHDQPGVYCTKRII